ncbi:hypothetical protein IAG25_39015 [Caballeronia sp. EK]|uniref:hypothetical protein n=1 Tax=Caballeronia sp. EK TaxID=2767469 RepID=UPI0016551B7A|nr:hypothetical protein [Caballeronia sp. EK]MBC8642789.1 hypothetical protein [Caballeronia sp. EK]
MNEYADLAKGILLADVRGQSMTIATEQGEVSFEETEDGVTIRSGMETVFLERLTLADLKENIKVDMIRNYSLYFDDGFDIALTNLGHNNFNERDVNLLNEIYSLPNQKSFEAFAYVPDAQASPLHAGDWSRMPGLTSGEMEILLRLRIERLDPKNYDSFGYLDLRAYQTSIQESMQQRYRPGEEIKEAVSIKAGFKLPELEELYLSQINGNKIDYRTMFGCYGYDEAGEHFEMIHPLIRFAMQCQQAGDATMEDHVRNINGNSWNIHAGLCEIYASKKASIDNALRCTFIVHGTLNIGDVGAARNILC